MDTVDFLSPVNTQFALALMAAGCVAYMAVRLSSGRSNRLAKRWPIYVLRSLLLLSLLLLLLNPVRVNEQKGSIEPSQIFFLLDASESMAIGNNNETRWDKAVQLIGNSAKIAHESAAADISLFRFGRRLKAVESAKELGLEDSLAEDGRGVTFVEKKVPSDAASSSAEAEASPADEPDTQLFVALRQISSRFGRKPPNAVVVFSDGRARDASRAEQVAAAFSKLKVPVHTVPVGNTKSGGDVALVSLVTPSSARKQSEVNAHAFLRSYGFDGKQVELKLNAVDKTGRRLRRLATIPVTLASGFQSVPISFRTDAKTLNIEAEVSQLKGEVSTDNNTFDTKMQISREKIRVLYVEGSRSRSMAQADARGQMRLVGPETPLKDALSEDDDIECVSVLVSTNQTNQAFSTSSSGAFPKSVAELSSFDAIILSDAPRRLFTPKQLTWIEAWVRQRGGGLCMVGGRNSFSSGQWKGSPVEKMLPVTLLDDFDWRGDVKVSLRADLNNRLHPLFRLESDEELNLATVGALPGFHGVNTGLLPKPNLTQVLAVATPGSLAAEAPQVMNQPPSTLFSRLGFGRKEKKPDAAAPTDGTLPDEFAAITVGQYGKGRTIAMAMPITGTPAEKFIGWGRSEGQNEHYGQFWRNLTYWLTERSYIGRRRLIANADKRYYGPGESISLSGAAFDESANPTSGYRLVGVIEPQSFDNIESDYSIVLWPNNVPREEESESPFIIWGEEFEIPVKKVAGNDVYQIDLALAETLPSGTANQSLRLELTAYEGHTQVDSTSVPIQILHDPFEQQNPFPNHELLETLAKESGGEVLTDEDELAGMLTSLPVVRGPSELRKSPLWSNWWAMAAILGLISTEWCYRRWIGLA